MSPLRNKMTEARPSGSAPYPEWRKRVQSLLMAATIPELLGVISEPMPHWMWILLHEVLHAREDDLPDPKNIADQLDAEIAKTVPEAKVVLNPIVYIALRNHGWGERFVKAEIVLIGPRVGFRGILKGATDREIWVRDDVAPDKVVFGVPLAVAESYGVLL
jgi:hypothetical protein